MKRDPELIRKLLLYLDEKHNDEAELVPKIDGYTDLEIMYHCLQLAQADFLDYEPEVTSSGRIIRAHVFSLTWQGHEFLDTIRDESLWKKGVSAVARETGGVAVDLLKAWAMHEAKHRLGLDLT